MAGRAVRLLFPFYVGLNQATACLRILDIITG